MVGRGEVKDRQETTGLIRFEHCPAVLQALYFASADKCPISGKPADSSITSTGKDGKTVAFCCEKCKTKFDAKNKP